MKIKDCKGCHSYHGKGHINTTCGTLPINKNEKCPCIDCLIKSVCDDRCEFLVKYCRIVES